MRKNKILAKFFSNYRMEDDPDLNILLELDDISKSVFDENKYKMSFDEVRLKTNEYIIILLQSNDYKI